MASARCVKPSILTVLQEIVAGHVDVLDAGAAIDALRLAVEAEALAVADGRAQDGGSVELRIGDRAAENGAAIPAAELVVEIGAWC